MAQRLTPFFPPTTPLHIIRLRVEFCRAFTRIAATGKFLGIDINPMLFRDFRGEAFERLLSQFSIMVIFRVNEIMKWAETAADASTPARSEQKSLIPIATAHHAALTNLLEKKQSQQSLRDSYSQVKHVMASKEAHTRNSRRVNKLQDKIDARGADQHAREVAESADQLNIDWEGNPKWKEIILGNKIEVPDEILEDSLSIAGVPVPGNSSDEAPASDQPSWSWNLDEIAKAQQGGPRSNLLEDLDERVKVQEANIERWKSFANEFHSDEHDSSTLCGSSPRPGSVIDRVEEYEKLMEMINTNVPGGYRPRKSRTGRNEKSQGSADNVPTSSNGSEIDQKAINFRSPDEKFLPVEEKSDVLSQENAQSTISGLSSPPNLPTPLKLPKPLKYQPSLVERTRVSMALTKTEDKAESSSNQSEDVSSLPIRIPVSPPSGSALKPTGSETLVERTRKSMSLLPVKSRAPRTPSSKKPSKTYPINPFETPKESGAEMPGNSTPPQELFGQNAKYASVFKSRPKVALSPTRAPSLGSMDVVHESKNDLFATQGTASSLPGDANQSTGRS